MMKKTRASPASEVTFRLGDWLVEPTLHRMTRGETSINIEQRIMSVLVCLAQHAGELVTRDDIVDTVWDNGFVTDNTITHAVTVLRKAFQDNSRAPKVIETIHGRGYRLIAPVVFDSEHSTREDVTRSSFVAVIRDVEVPLREGENLIGRADEAAITIPSMKVSRYHARISVGGGAACLEDLASKNGTFLNGARIHELVGLRNGDLIGIGCVTEIIRFIDSLGGHTTEPASYA